jgi:hypothetical protein
MPQNESADKAHQASYPIYTKVRIELYGRPESFVEYENILEDTGCDPGALCDH